MRNLLHIAVLLILNICLCEGIVRCYSCSSTTEPRCNDDFGLTSPVAKDCPGTCIKRRGKRDNAGVKVVEVTRGCVSQTDEKCFDTTYNGISVYACTCNTNYCNSGTMTTLSPLTFFTVAVACFYQLGR